MKKFDIEIYNYLNLINERLGKAYKASGKNPLPENFVIDKQKIKEVIQIGQLKNEDIFPNFANEDKDKIKKNFINFLKNCKKIKKNIKNFNFSDDFRTFFETYLNMQILVFKSLKKEFGNQSFDEVSAFREVYNINTILGQYMLSLFDGSVNLNETLDKIEDKYHLAYVATIRLLEEKENKKRKKYAKAANVQQMSATNAFNLSNKNSTKTKDENGIMLDKRAEAKAKQANKLQAEKIREQIKNSKSTEGSNQTAPSTKQNIKQSLKEAEEKTNQKIKIEKISLSATKKHEISETKAQKTATKTNSNTNSQEKHKAK